jgi:hypothetical protein
MLIAKSKPHVINDDVRKKLTVIRDDIAEDINNLFKSKNKRHREEDTIIIENNNLLNMRDKDNQLSSSSSPSSSSSSIILTSHSRTYV